MKEHDNERARQFLPFAALPMTDESEREYERRPKHTPKRKELPLKKDEIS